MNIMFKLCLVLLLCYISLTACTQKRPPVTRQEVSVVELKINFEHVSENETSIAYFAIIEAGSGPSDEEYKARLQVADLGRSIDGIWYFKFAGSCSKSVEDVHALLKEALPQSHAELIITTSSMACVEPNIMENLPPIQLDR